MGLIKSFFSGVLIALGIVVTLNLLSKIGLLGIGEYFEYVGSNIGTLFQNIGNLRNMTG